jgi:hypothetical protein
MKRLGRILIGAVLALAGMTLALWVFAVLAIYSPFPLATWRTHSSFVLYASEVISFVPIVLLLGFVLWKLFPVRPTLDASLSMILALPVSVAGAWDTPRALYGTLMAMPQFWVTFTLGVPAFVYILARLRSNYRLERP